MDFACPNNVVFECCKCGLCCGDTNQKIRHILLLESEAKVISAKTCLPQEAFSKQIVNKKPYCHEMKKNNDCKCFFLKNNQCSIYELRPLICRFYPFELKFDSDKDQYVFNFTLECPGITKGSLITRKDFEELFSLAQQRLS